jgi:hypothetical protein
MDNQIIIKYLESLGAPTIAPTKTPVRTPTRPETDVPGRTPQTPTRQNPSINPFKRNPGVREVPDPKNMADFVDQMDADELKKMITAAAPTTAPTKTPVRTPSRPGVDVPGRTPQRPTRQNPSINPFKQNPGIREVPQPKNKPFGQSLIQRIVGEAIKYGDMADRMNPDLEKRITDRQHALGKYDYFTKKGDSHVEEEAAAERFIDLLKKVRKTINLPTVDVTRPQIHMFYMQTFQALLGEIQEIETGNEKELEQAAVKLISDYFKIPEGSLTFDVKIKFKASDCKKCKPKPPQEMEDELEDLPEEELSDEFFKRHFINYLTQGASVTMSQAHMLASEELDKISPGLLDKYSSFMHLADLGLWLMDDPPHSMMTDGDDDEDEEHKNIGGKTWVDMDTDPPTIHARADNFPLLLHELTKGVFEFLSLYGLPKDEEEIKKIYGQTDQPENEFMALRIGSYFWKKLNILIHKQGCSDLLATIYSQIVQLPANQFKKFVQDMLENESEASAVLQEICKKVKWETEHEKYLNDEDEKEEARQRRLDQEERDMQSGGNEEY